MSEIPRLSDDQLTEALRKLPDVWERVRPDTDNPHLLPGRIDMRACVQALATLQDRLDAANRDLLRTDSTMFSGDEDLWTPITPYAERDAAVQRAEAAEGKLKEAAVQCMKAESDARRLRTALEQYATCTDGCTCGDGWSHDVARDALAAAPAPMCPNPVLEK